MTVSGFEVREIRVPDDLAGPGAADFLGLVEVRNGVEAATLGTDALVRGAESSASILRDSPGRARRHFVARVGERVVGRAIVAWSTAAGTPEGIVEVDVLPDHRGGGIGAALLEAAEAAATSVGRRSVQSHVAHTLVPGPTITSPTGVGHVSAEDPGVRFLLRHGYTLELVARISSLDLTRAREPVPAVADAYRTVAWEGPTPEERLDDLAALKTAMSTDTPMGAMEMTVDPWDAERVRERDDRMAAGGSRLFTAAAEHVATGRLVAYTELDVAGDGFAAIQADTLVVRAHRGHRLGLAVKAANIQQVREVVPRATTITTFNAEDNTPMLAVNEALGFLSIGREGNWQKRFT